MNSTILLALIIAWAAVYALKTIVVQLIKRKAGRAALAEVGKRALTRLPEQVRSCERIRLPGRTPLPSSSKRPLCGRKGSKIWAFTASTKYKAY